MRRTAVWTFPASDGRTLVVVCQARCFPSNTFEDLVDEAVHDPHSLAGNTSVRVDLLQNLVHVDSITLTSPPASLSCGLSAASAAFFAPFQLGSGGTSAVGDSLEN